MLLLYHLFLLHPIHPLPVVVAVAVARLVSRQKCVCITKRDDLVLLVRVRKKTKKIVSCLILVDIYTYSHIAFHFTDCTYAHGQEELQMTKLLDLHRAGLVDAHVYRTLPCFSLVSTGACPFGKRCTSLHPPELSNGSSWLPLTETQGNTISTDINVEALHQKRLAEITVGHDTPDLDLHRDDWNDWYRQVCNLQYTSSPSRRSLTPNIKLQIALLLRDNADWSYKFRPQHVVCNEQCMLLTEAAFFVTSHGHVQPLPLHSYRSSQPRHVHVRELAFGPDVDPSVRGVSLYFNLPLSAITVCTAQQAKRYRWKKRMPNWTTTMTTTTTSSLLDGMDSFPMIRSHDVILFGLQTRALQHRLAVLQAENGLDLHRRHAATAQLRQVKQQLQRDWNAWKCSVQMWSWPPKRVVLDRKTPVPAVDGDYIPPETSVVASLWSTCRTAPWKESDDDGWVRLFVISLLFSSLTHTPQNISHEHVFDEASPLVLMRKSPLPIRPSSTSPISILRQLSQGMSISPDRHLPHIHRKYLPPRPARPASYDACWKALLLQSSTNNNDWAIVHEHFSKSRSKKVLSIIQKG